MLCSGGIFQIFKVFYIFFINHITTIFRYQVNNNLIYIVKFCYGGSESPSVHLCISLNSVNFCYLVQVTAWCIEQYFTHIKGRNVFGVVFEIFVFGDFACFLCFFFEYLHRSARCLWNIKVDFLQVWTG